VIPDLGSNRRLIPMGFPRSSVSAPLQLTNPERDHLSDLSRATGLFPDNSRLTNLIQVLTTGNERFADLWASGAAGALREDRMIVEHHGVGQITVDCDVMTGGDAELKIVILSAAPDTQDETNLRLAFLSVFPDTRS
jgi:hypothetical protein